jgi:hypothetical protein
MGRKKNENTMTISQRVNEWRKKTSVAYTIKLNKEYQSDVIEKLAQVDNKTQYIVDLIRADLGTTKNDKAFTLSDLAKELKENEKARLEFVDGRFVSVWHANKKDIENDTRIVKYWFRDSDNMIVAKVKAR